MPALTRSAARVVRARSANRLQRTFRRHRAYRPANDVCPFTQSAVDPADAILLVSEPGRGRPAPGTAYIFTAGALHHYVTEVDNRHPFTNEPLNAVEMYRLKKIVGKTRRRSRWDRSSNPSILDFMDTELGSIVEGYMLVAEVADYPTCHEHILSETIHGIQSIVVQFARVDAAACIRAIEHAVTVCEGPADYPRHRHVNDPRSIVLIVGMLNRFRQALLPPDDDDDDSSDLVVEEMEEEATASEEEVQRL